MSFSEWINNTSGAIAGVALLITSINTIWQFINNPIKKKEDSIIKRIEQLERRQKESYESLELMNKQQARLTQFIILNTMTQAIEKGFRNELLSPYLAGLYESYEKERFNHISKVLFEEYFDLPTEVEYLKEYGEYKPSQETTEYMERYSRGSLAFEDQIRMRGEQEKEEKEEKGRRNN